MTGDYISDYENRQNTRKEIYRSIIMLGHEKERLNLILCVLEDQITILKEYGLYKQADKLKGVYNLIEKGRDNLSIVNTEVSSILRDTKEKGDIY